MIVGAVNEWVPVPVTCRVATSRERAEFRATHVAERNEQVMAAVVVAEEPLVAVIEAVVVFPGRRAEDYLASLLAWLDHAHLKPVACVWDRDDADPETQWASRQFALAGYVASRGRPELVELGHPGLRYWRGPGWSRKASWVRRE